MLQRHFILTNGRSGSNYFVQLLNQHRSVVNFGEVIGDWTFTGRWLKPVIARNGNACAYLDFIYANRAFFAGAQYYSLINRSLRKRKSHFRRRCEITTIGVKELAVNMRREGLNHYLAQRKDIKLITLVRQNPLDRYISWKLMMLTGQIAQRKGEAASANRQILLDTNGLVKDLETIESEDNEIVQHELRHQGPTFRLDYESYFNGEKAERKRILENLYEFLGVPWQDITGEHERLRNTTLRETVINYDEMVSRLANTRFERWLDDKALH